MSNKYNKLKKLYENKDAVYRLNDLFNFFIFSKGIDANLGQLVEKYTDAEIYAILHNLYKKKFGKDKMIKSKKDGLIKSSINRYRLVESIVKYNIGKVSKNDISILDVGTEDCKYIYKLEKLGTTYGINIATEEFTSYLTDKSCITIYDGVNIPYKDNTIDIVTCTMVIHHMDRPKDTLKDIYRIMKPGGLFIIREHDCNNEYTEIIVDAEHFMHAMIINPEYDTSYYNNYNITYYTKNEMHKLITDIGFEHSPQSLPKRYRGIRGASRKYYDVFTKLHPR